MELLYSLFLVSVFSPSFNPAFPQILPSFSQFLFGKFPRNKMNPLPLTQRMLHNDWVEINSAPNKAKSDPLFFSIFCCCFFWLIDPAMPLFFLVNVCSCLGLPVFLFFLFFWKKPICLFHHFFVTTCLTQFLSFFILFFFH